MAKRLTIEEQIKQAENRLATLKARSREKERKERTRRLITIGARVEKYAGEIHDFEAFDQYLAQYGSYIAKTQGLTNQSKKSQ